MLDWTAFGLECDNKTKFHLSYGGDGMNITLIGSTINTSEFVSRREDYFDKIDKFKKWSVVIFPQDKIKKKIMVKYGFQRNNYLNPISKACQHNLIFICL